MTHRITMTYEATNPHTGGHMASVETELDGSLDHACDTFKAFLIACGYAAETVDRMVIEWSDELQTANAELRGRFDAEQFPERRVHATVPRRRSTGEKMTIFRDQSDFMTVMGQEQTVENADLYAELVNEEAVRELLPALDKYLGAPTTENLVEVVDGAIDSIVVIAGLLNCLIGPDMAQAAWEEVQRSNMSKAHWSDSEGRYIVLRREDGKVLKPATYSRPRLFELVARVSA